MFELMEFYAGIHPSKTLLYSIDRIKYGILSCGSADSDQEFCIHRLHGLIQLHQTS